MSKKSMEDVIHDFTRNKQIKRDLAQALTDEGFGNIDEVRLYYSKMIDREYVKKEDVREVDESAIWKVINSLDTLDAKDFKYYTPNRNEQLLMTDFKNACFEKVVTALAEALKRGELWKD